MIQRIALLVIVLAAALLVAAQTAFAYPPGVGILGKSRSCLVCHSSNGPWTDEETTIVDILDSQTRQSLRAGDGSFLIQIPRGEKRTVITVIGRPKEEIPPPHRNAWLYIDPTQIPTTGLSKFAPGWDVNLPMSCRIVGDQVEEYKDASVTALPMTIRPGDGAADADLELQIMLTTGEAVKGKPKEGLISNYVVRKVRLVVLDQQPAPLPHKVAQPNTSAIPAHWLFGGALLGGLALRPRKRGQAAP